MTQMLRGSPVDADDDGQILDMIDRWVARELKPIVKEYDHADRYPHADRRADEGARPVRRDDRRRSMAASACRRRPTPRS